MISVNGPEIQVEGRKVDVAAEICALVHAMVYDMNDGKGIFTKEQILDFVNDALLTEEELNARMAEKLKNDPIGSMLAGLMDAFPTF